ncbi:MAG: hypothetical protein MMC33_009469 [Icmadophila ericetorum]|nr:hypothetical protein [Icmadophila ericetorum]
MSQRPEDGKPVEISAIKFSNASMKDRLVDLEDNHPAWQSLEVQMALDQFFSGASEQPIVEWLARQEGLDPKTAVLRKTPMTLSPASRHKMSLLGPVEVLVDLEEHYRDRMQICDDDLSGMDRISTSNSQSQTLDHAASKTTLEIKRPPMGDDSAEPKKETVPYFEVATDEHIRSEVRTFTYDDLQQGEIRLLHWDRNKGRASILELHTVRLEDAPPYSALSYVWGSPERNASLYCNGKVLKITRSLATALEATLSHSEKSYIWADAICINQDNLAERSEQVLLMAEIYTKAYKVLAHLKAPSGTGENSADWPAISLMNYLNRIWYFDSDYALKQDSEWERLKIPSPSEEKIWNTLVQFWLNPWFTRTWILQEAILGQEVILFFGEALCSLNAVTTFWDLAQRRDMPQILKHGLLADLHAVSRNIGQIGTIMKLRDWRKDTDAALDTNTVSKLLVESNQDKLVPKKPNRGKITLLELLIMASAAGSSDPRDKVYSMLGLAEDDEVAKSIKPDYSDKNTVAKVYTDVAVKYIEAGFGADILHSAGNYRLIPSLPSWVPDWTHKPRSSFNPGLYNFSGRSSANFKLSKDKRNLTLRGVIIDSIKIAGLPCRYYDLNTWQDKFHQMKTIEKKPPVVTDQEMRQIVHNFLQTLVPLCCSEDTHPEGIYNALGRTLTADTTWSGQRSDSIFTESYDAYRRLSEFAPEPPEGTTGEEPGSKVHNQPRMGWVWRFEPAEEAALREKAWPYEAAMQEVQKGRRTCITDGGRLCTATHDTEGGDLIVLVEGCTMPMVLRREDEMKSFTLMGDCYLHGFMDGELIVRDIDKYLDRSKVSIDRDGRRYAVKNPKGGFATFLDFPLI